VDVTQSQSPQIGSDTASQEIADHCRLPLRASQSPQIGSDTARILLFSIDIIIM